MLASGSGTRVYGVWTDLSGTPADTLFAISTDGGATWGSRTNLTNGEGNASVKPFIVVAPGKGAGGADRIFVIYNIFNGNLRDIVMRRSNDGGASFDAQTARIDDGSDSFHHHAAVSSDGGTLAIVWERLDTSGSTLPLPRSIRSRVWSEADSAFKGELTINVGSGTAPQASQPQVAIANRSGGLRFAWTWRESRDSDGGGTADKGATNDVFAAFSNAADAAPTADVQLDGDSTDARDVDTLQMLTTGSNVYIAWQDIGATSDISFVRSTDSGASWSARVVVDDPAGVASSSFAPSLAVFAGATPAADLVGLAWQDDRDGSQIFAAVSSDAGAHFGTAVRASSDAGSHVLGDTSAPRLAFASATKVVVAYVNTRSTVHHVYASQSINAGANWAFTDTRLDTAHPAPGEAVQPSIARTTANGGGAAVGWIDFSRSSTNGDVYVRRFGR